MLTVMLKKLSVNQFNNFDVNKRTLFSNIFVNDISQTNDQILLVEVEFDTDFRVLELIKF